MFESIFILAAFGLLIWFVFRKKGHGHTAGCHMHGQSTEHQNHTNCNMGSGTDRDVKHNAAADKSDQGRSYHENTSIPTDGVRKMGHSC